MPKQAIPKGPKAQNKMAKVMGEYASGGLHSGSKAGPQVKNRKQAIAIAISETKKKARGGYKK